MRKSALQKIGFGAKDDKESKNGVEGMRLRVAERVLRESWGLRPLVGRANRVWRGCSGEVDCLGEEEMIRERVEMNVSL